MVVVLDSWEEVMKVKEVKTGKVIDVPESVVQAWPGSYVRADESQKPSDRAVSTVSAAAGTKKERKSS